MMRLGTGENEPFGNIQPAIPETDHKHFPPLPLPMQPPSGIAVHSTCAMLRRAFSEGKLDDDCIMAMQLC